MTLSPLSSAPGSPPPRRGDLVLGFLVLALAFLSASFLARNSDLWFHLAAGRLIAEGKYPFGADPFACTTENVYWANHSWLFDLLLYALNGRVGGAGLVALKALLVAALAALLLLVRRPGAAFAPAVAGTTLAVLALGPRLLLQPACVSYFFLALALWLLTRPYLRPAPTPSRRPYFLLLAVFVLWVNVDEWFFLGPLLAALFWLGGRLDGSRHTPGWVPAAGLAVCLLNPHAFHAFAVPADLSPVTWADGLRDDPRLRPLFASPWQAPYLRAAAEFNAGILAYYTLTALSLLSFALCRPARRDWRAVVWLPFAALAAWQARTVPFFAVVAGPVAALNLQDFLAARPDTKRERGSALTWGLGLVLLALIVLSWPGWLAGRGREDRHVAWGVREEPSLRRAAETLRAWRGRGLLGDGEHVFAPPEAAHYIAWFCPGGRYFFDHRYPLFAGAAARYERVSRWLAAPAGEEADAEDCRAVLRTHGVRVLIVHDREPGRLRAAQDRLSGDPEHWALLDVAGSALLYGWKDARPAGGFAALTLDPERLAFGPPDEWAEERLPPAPNHGPASLPARRGWREELARPAAPPAWESPAAAAYLREFDAGETRQRQWEMDVALAAYAAGLAGLPTLPPGGPTAAAPLHASHNLLFARGAGAAFLTREQLGPYFAHLTDRPAALPLLAVRAARRAVAADPADAAAWLRLGRAYLRLRGLTCEHSAEGLLPPLARVRLVQVAAALEQALRLDPDLEEAHHELAYLYGERRYLDVALDHRRHEWRIARRSGPRPGEEPADHSQRLEAMAYDVERLEEMVRRGREEFAVAVRRLPGDKAPQAGLALRLGLARQAAEEVLLPTPADVLGPEGIAAELDLLLALGRADEVRAILGDPRALAGKSGLPPHDLPAPRTPDGTPLYPIPYRWPSYEWLRALESAAVGDYAEARGALRAIRTGLGPARAAMRRQAALLREGRLGLLPGMLSGPPPYLPALMAGTAARSEQDVLTLEDRERALAAQQADLLVLEGMLALEQGNPADARSAFAAARKMGEESGVSFAGAPVAGYYLGRLHPQAWPAGNERSR